MRQVQNVKLQEQHARVHICSLAKEFLTVDEKRVFQESVFNSSFSIPKHISQTTMRVEKNYEKSYIMELLHIKFSEYHVRYSTDITEPGFKDYRGQLGQLKKDEEGWPFF